ncbi:MAG: hypothetical protein JSU94_04535 [Phycisphaerales bacterium]|nr:MAG: hypothetical protein JSU94_04535 [Phycisphaerales bacterium]
MRKTICFLIVGICLLAAGVALPLEERQILPLSDADIGSVVVSGDCQRCDDEVSCPDRYCYNYNDPIGGAMCKRDDDWMWQDINGCHDVNDPNWSCVLQQWDKCYIQKTFFRAAGLMCGAVPPGWWGIDKECFFHTFNASTTYWSWDDCEEGHP